MNTEFYKQLLAIKREREISTRQLAKECNICYGTLVKFFNPEKEFTPIRDVTKARLHNRLGISYEVMDEYNKEIEKMKVGN